MVTVLTAVTFLILRGSMTTWQKVSGSQDAATQLVRAEAWLKRDLDFTEFDQLQTGPSLSNLAGRDGDVVWFLSAYDPNTGQYVRDTDGRPVWQRNIVYYCVIPDGLPATVHSGTGIDDGGYEVSHPAKLIVRKVVDLEPDPTVPEPLIPDVTPYLERPTGAVVNAPNSESVTIIGRDFLSFRVSKNNNLRSVDVVLQAARLKDRQLEFAIGSESLIRPGYLLERRLQIFTLANRPASP